jgi:short-subunit dehydrogenase
VSLADEVSALWDSAAQRFGRIDIWINNAGIGHPMLPVWELPPAKTEMLVNVNINGVLNGSRTAIKGMIAQGGGFLYNMEGFGSNGRTRDGLSVYGMTKAAVTFLSKSLVSEVSETSVKVGMLSPGIVITEFITDQYVDDPEGLESAKRIFNILGDRVETVTPWLADHVLANDKNGAAFEWLTRGKAMKRFMTASFNKRDLFV